MRFSIPEWLLITSVFGLSVAANMPASMQAAVPVTQVTLQTILALLLAYALVRYTPLPIVIAVNMLLVGSGVPWLLDSRFGIPYWVCLVIIAATLLLSVVLHATSADEDSPPSTAVGSQSVQALFRVVEQGNIAWTHRLIAMGADVNVRNEVGQTPLISATKKGYADMVQVLLQNGANPRLANNEGESALTIALMKGYTRIAESLEMAEATHKYEAAADHKKA